MNCYPPCYCSGGGRLWWSRIGCLGACSWKTGRDELGASRDSGRHTKTYNPAGKESSVHLVAYMLQSDTASTHLDLSIAVTVTVKRYMWSSEEAGDKYFFILTSFGSLLFSGCDCMISCSLPVQYNIVMWRHPVQLGRSCWRKTGTMY